MNIIIGIDLGSCIHRILSIFAFAFAFFSFYKHEPGLYILALDNYFSDFFVALSTNFSRHSVKTNLLLSFISIT